VVAQGKKQVKLGQNTFIYDPSRFLLTSIDLPVVSRVVEATEETPCLVLLLKLEMATIREMLSLEEIHVASAPSDAPAMATAEATPEFLDACCRLLALLETPRDIPFLSGLIQREIIYRVLQGNAGARLRALATLGDHRPRHASLVLHLVDSTKTSVQSDLRLSRHLPFRQPQLSGNGTFGENH
jgi:hypothetical protein